MAAGMVLATSCTDKLDELLENPNAVNATTASPDFLLNRIQLDYQSLWFGMSDRGARLTRQINQSSALYESAYNAGSTNGTWSNAYANILADINFLIPLAEKSNLQRHMGIAKTIKAMVLMDLVDTYGNVPYSEALDAANFNPKVDDAATIYATALKLLDEASAHFSATTSGGSPNDYYYGRNYPRWIKLTNTLKLKYFLNTKAVNAAASKTGIDALIAGKNLIGPADDFVFRFGTTAADPDSRHPKFAGQYTSGGGDYQSTDYMHHLTVEKGFDDPRVRYYLYRQVLTNTTNVDEQECVSQIPPPHYLIGGYPYCNPTGNKGYWGRDHLDPDGIPPDGLKRTAYGVFPAGGRYDNSSGVPVNNKDLGMKGAGLHPIMLAAYVDFMLAEAAITLGTTGDAKSLLLSAIKKHMDYVRAFAIAGAEGATVSAFEPAATFTGRVTNYIKYVDIQYVAAATASDKMSVVGREYWLSLYGNGKESFDLYRRTGKPVRMQPGLEAITGPFVRSFLYPNNYMITNTKAVQKANLATQVFWDKNPASPWIY